MTVYKVVALYPALQRGLREPTSGLYVCVGGTFLTELSPSPQLLRFYAMALLDLRVKLVSSDKPSLDILE